MPSITGARVPSCESAASVPPPVPAPGAEQAAAEALALIEGRKEFVVKRTSDYIAIDYLVAFADTFDDIRRAELRGIKFHADNGAIMARPGVTPGASGTTIYLKAGSDLAIPLGRVEAAGGKVEIK